MVFRQKLYCLICLADEIKAKKQAKKTKNKDSGFNNKEK